MSKQFGIERPFIRNWKQRLWYVTKAARDLAVKHFGGKKIAREKPDRYEKT